jgi:hypothetical protein
VGRGSGLRWRSARVVVALWCAVRGGEGGGRASAFLVCRRRVRRSGASSQGTTSSTEPAHRPRFRFEAEAAASSARTPGKETASSGQTGHTAPIALRSSPNAGPTLVYSQSTNCICRVARKRPRCRGRVEDLQNRIPSDRIVANAMARTEQIVPSRGNWTVRYRNHESANPASTIGGSNNAAALTAGRRQCPSELCGHCCCDRFP